MLDLQVRSAHPPNCAPNQLFKLLRCSGRLIRQAETLDLQVRSAHPPNCTRPAAALNPCTIQDRVSPPPKRCREARRLPDSRGGKGRVKLSPVSAPNQLFKLLRCSGRLIFRKSHLAFSTKRSTSRFAPLTLRTALARWPHSTPAQSKTG